MKEVAYYEDAGLFYNMQHRLELGESDLFDGACHRGNHRTVAARLLFAFRGNRCGRRWYGLSGTSSNNRAAGEEQPEPHRDVDIATVASPAECMTPTLTQDSC